MVREESEKRFVRSEERVGGAKENSTDGWGENSMSKAMSWDFNCRRWRRRKRFASEGEADFERVMEAVRRECTVACTMVCARSSKTVELRRR